LTDGVVLWLQADLCWSQRISDAAHFAAAAYPQAKAKAEADMAANKVVAVYDIPVDGMADHSARELIRAAGGPSIMPPADRPG